jgi:hypothetical protein
MVALRNGLRDSGTGESKLAGLDAEIKKRVESGSSIHQPRTSEEWQAYAQGSTRAADFLAANAEVTRAKAHGISSAIVRQARERRAAALAAEDAMELVGRPAALEAAAGVAGRIGPGGGEPRVPKGIVKRLGPDPNLTGSGVLYRWSGDAEAMEVNPQGADIIELVSGDCQMVENRLVRLPVVDARFRVLRRGRQEFEDVVWVNGAALAPQAQAGGDRGGPGLADVGGVAPGGSDGGSGAGVAQGGPTASTGEGGPAVPEPAPKESWELTDAEMERLTKPGNQAGGDQGKQAPAAENAGA